MKKSLLLDVDEVVCFAGFLPAINEFMNTDYKIGDTDNYYLDEAFIPKEKFEEFQEYLSSIDLYEKAELLPGAKEVIEELNYLYDLHVCSSCINPFNVYKSAKAFSDKYNYLISVLPFLDPNKFIFTSSKYLLVADILIDDRLNNLKSNNIDTKILFPSYHNQNITDNELINNNVIRAGYDWNDGWNEVEKILVKNLY